MQPPIIQEGSYPIIRRTLTIGIVGFADAGKTEFLLSLAAIDKSSIPDWEIIRVGEGLQLFIEARVNYGKTASTDVLESRFTNLSLLLLRSKVPVDGAILELELRASDYAGEVFSDFAAMTERFKEEAELRKWKDEHFAGLLTRLGASDMVIFVHHCLSPLTGASRLNYTLLLSRIANSRKQGPLPLIVAVSRADELADKTADATSLPNRVAECLHSTGSEPCNPSRYPAQLKASNETALAVLDGMFLDLRRAMDGPGILSKALLISSWGHRSGTRSIGGSHRPNPLQPQGVHFVLDQAIQQMLPALRHQIAREREAETRRVEALRDQVAREREAEAHRQQAIADQARRRGYGVAVFVILAAMLAGVVVQLYRNSLPS
jgi:hypothetical protein